jgi:hypothetical protein
MTVDRRQVVGGGRWWSDWASPTGQRPRPEPPELPVLLLAPTGAPRRWAWDPPPCPPPECPFPTYPRRDDEATVGLPDRAGLPGFAGRPGLPDEAGLPRFSQVPAAGRFFLCPLPACPGDAPVPGLSDPLARKSPWEPFPDEPFRSAGGRAFHDLVGRRGRSDLPPPVRAGAPAGVWAVPRGSLGRRFGGSPITAETPAISGTVVPMGMPRSRWIRLTALALSGVTRLTTTPVAPARAVRPDRCT